MSDVGQITQPVSAGGMQLKASDVARLVSSIFCEQIYEHGHVHCDPRT